MRDAIHKDRIKNLARAWAQVSDSDMLMGERAYPVYHETLKGMAAHYNAPFVQTVEAFVALSPNNDYHGNLRSLASLLHARRRGHTFEHCTISTYRSCGARAWGYLSGEVSFLDTVKGRKIISFRDNILYLDKSKRVTVDGHMICIAEGHSMTMTEANYRLRDGRIYDQIEAEVLALSRRVKQSPCRIQATLWTWRKRTLGIKIDTQADLFTGKTKWDGVIPAIEIEPYARRIPK